MYIAIDRADSEEKNLDQTSFGSRNRLITVLMQAHESIDPGWPGIPLLSQGKSRFRMARSAPYAWEPTRQDRRDGASGGAEVADIVLGLASSHTPQMSTSAEF